MCVEQKVCQNIANSKKRLEYVDLMKGICITLVVATHCGVCIPHYLLHTHQGLICYSSANFPCEIIYFHHPKLSKSAFHIPAIFSCEKRCDDAIACLAIRCRVTSSCIQFNTQRTYPSTSPSAIISPSTPSVIMSRNEAQVSKAIGTTPICCASVSVNPHASLREVIMKIVGHGGDYELCENIIKNEDIPAVTLDRKSTRLFVEFAIFWHTFCSTHIRV